MPIYIIVNIKLNIFFHTGNSTHPDPLELQTNYEYSTNGDHHEKNDKILLRRDIYLFIASGLR
ncbi:hypothetical protein DYD21_15465 [Rhodohalobacter sp. SW132]|nr:hypothetical protein DYD21_15465 [Rhodohalobacter sp. SW132]